MVCFRANRLRTFFVRPRGSGPPILSFSNLLTGCASSGFFTGAGVSGDERRLAAPSPTCFEVWRGRGSFFQWARCTGGGGSGDEVLGCLWRQRGVSWRVSVLKEGGAEPGDEGRTREGKLPHRYIKSRSLVFCLWKYKLLRATNHISLRSFFY